MEFTLRKALGERSERAEGDLVDTDRHGRAGRSPVDRKRRPVDGYRMPDRRRFLRLVTDVLADLPPPLDTAVTDADLGIAEVPDVPDGAEEHDDAEVPLVRVVTDGNRVTRVIVYRRPFETRALSRSDLIDLLRGVFAEELAVALGIDPDDLDT